MENRFLSALEKWYYTTYITELRADKAKRNPLTHNSMLYMKIICKNSGKYTISNIASILRVATTAVTQKVNELEKKGYVYRKQSENDRRVVYLYSAEKVCPNEEEFIKRNLYVKNKLHETYSKEEISRFLDIFEDMAELNLEYDKKRE